MVNVKVIEGDLPQGGGYKLMTFSHPTEDNPTETPMSVMLWYARAVKNARITGKPLADDAYVVTITYPNGKKRWTLWKKERKNGKMVGVGHKDLKQLDRKK